MRERKACFGYDDASIMYMYLLFSRHKIFYNEMTIVVMIIMWPLS